MDKQKEFEYKEITVRIKHYPNGIDPSPNLICDFCKKNLKRTLTSKPIHYLLCEDCRLLFNRKLVESVAVIQQSGMGIGIFQEKRFGK
jgi:hypothetical protein